MAGRRRQRVGHTEDWEQLRLLVKWPEQQRYEEIRPLVLFGDRRPRPLALQQPLFAYLDAI